MFGVTGIVIAPEHPRIEDLTTQEHKQKVNNYIKEVQGKSDLDRTELNKEKTGVFTGAYAINPVNGQKVPIWVADYVVGFYGTGAVMLVPAHDSRDYEFATKFGFDVVRVISKDGKDTELTEPFLGKGQLLNSGQFNGLDNEEAKKAITEYLISIDKGGFKTNYKVKTGFFPDKDIGENQFHWFIVLQTVSFQCQETELPLKLPEVRSMSQPEPVSRWPQLMSGLIQPVQNAADRPKGKQTPCHSGQARVGTI